MDSIFSGYFDVDHQFQLEDDNDDIFEEEIEDATAIPQAAELSEQSRRVLYGPGVEEIEALFSSTRKQKAKVGRKKTTELPPQYAKMLGEANLCYIEKKFSQAIQLLHEIIRNNPQAPDPYQTLGVIYEEMNRLERAVEFFIIAAHLSKRDIELWRHAAIMSKELGNFNRAIYCFNKILKIEPNDTEALWERSLLYTQLGDFRKAVEGFEILTKIHPHPEVFKQLAKV